MLVILMAKFATFNGYGQPQPVPAIQQNPLFCKFLIKARAEENFDLRSKTNFATVKKT